MRLSLKTIAISIAATFTLSATLSSCSSQKPKPDVVVKPVTVITDKDTYLDHNPCKLNDDQRALIKEAFEWLGTPYAYACDAKGKGTDCSGMTMRIYLDVLNVKLPRNSAKQAEACKEIKKEQLRPGDLVFFATGKDPKRISHVGIMISDREFIHASSSKGVQINSLESPYYTRTFIKAGRVER